MYPLRASYINGWLKYFGDYGAKLSEVRDLLIRDLQTTPNAEFPNFNGTVIFYTDYKSDYAIFAAIFIFVGFFVAEFTSIGFVFVLLKMLESRKESFSVMTYKLHRQLTVALGVQLLTPFLFIILPVTYGIIRTYWQDITAEQGRLIIDFIELYGASNSLVTLYFIKPYRTFLITKFKPILRLLTCGNYGNGSQEVVKIQPAETTLASEVINGDFNERKRSIIPVIK
ncbi:unnamed protein product [Bursaphelenchus xylophilus]|uniref:(pine wood nematode) hypothetical protein n=1 Tax=Bursaphelenchus xylophilus TaxID=6326 RepID=A0A1I7SH63_BURXY|nr:unnamed protein product [Bursaphelenchus xylophilus]CAG9121183.1 unnamed protein product [Bursaphelenchus xylophilus]